MAIDSYLLGSPNETSNYGPFCSVLMVNGSIRTERINQDIRFYVNYRKGQNSSADYLSRHAVS